VFKYFRPSESVRLAQCQLYSLLSVNFFTCDLQVMKFAIGQSSTYTFPVRNSGDIPLDVDLQFSDWSELFSVCPMRVQLDPGQQLMSTVTFRHHPVLHETVILTQYER